MDKNNTKSIIIMELIEKIETNPRTIQNVVVRYSDGNDYSHFKVNSEEHPEHGGCVMCGSTEVTITDEADICHESDCRYVYT